MDEIITNVIIQDSTFYNVKFVYIYVYISKLVLPMFSYKKSCFDPTFFSAGLTYHLASCKDQQIGKLIRPKFKM